MTSRQRNPLRNLVPLLPQVVKYHALRHHQSPAEVVLQLLHPNLVQAWLHLAVNARLPGHLQQLPPVEPQDLRLEVSLLLRVGQEEHLHHRKKEHLPGALP